MTQSEISYNFGRHLQSLRNAKGISLDEVSQKTKIRDVVLRQIENEDLDKLPDPTITKGFLRAYAHAIDCDPDEAVKRYEAKISVRQQSDEIQRVPEESPGRFWLRIIPIFLLLIVFIVIALFFSSHFEKEKPATPPAAEEGSITEPAPHADAGDGADNTAPASETPDSATEAPDDQVAAEPEESSAISPEHEMPPATSPPAISNDQASGQTAVGTGETEVAPPEVQAIEAAEPTETPSVVDTDADETTAPEDAVPGTEAKVLQVRANELTWFKITLDGDQTREMTLKPGERMIFRADKSFELLIGNAAGLALELDGEPVPVRGESGKVISVRLP